MATFKRQRSRRPTPSASMVNGPAVHPTVEPEAEPEPHPMLVGQRLLGNQAVLRALRAGPASLSALPVARLGLGNQATQLLLGSQSGSARRPSPATASGALQRFDTNEHRLMGDQGSANAAGK